MNDKEPIDAQEVSIDEVKEFTTDVKKCPNCGSDLKYNPEKYCLDCIHCGTTQAIEGKSASKVEFYELPDESEADWATGMRSYRCNNCGAKTFVEGYEISPACSFCGATNIVEISELPGLKPNGVLPFSRTRSDTAIFAKKWIKKKFFAPNKLKKQFKTDTIKGVYMPVFTFDSKVCSVYEGRLGKRKTRTVHRNGKTYTETYIDWFRVSGTLDRDFKELMVEACDKVTQNEMEKIMPFDSYNAAEFQNSYLSGFSALRYNQGVNSSWNIAREIIDEAIRKQIVAMYHADVVDYINLDTYHSHTSYKYILVPVWMCNYEYKGKKYGFIMNGRSGKITGKTPVSPAKVSFVVFLGLAVIAGIALILHYFG
jgi:ribosomal protein S27AE